VQQQQHQQQHQQKKFQPGQKGGYANPTPAATGKRTFSNGPANAQWQANKQPRTAGWYGGRR